MVSRQGLPYGARTVRCAKRPALREGQFQHVQQALKNLPRRFAELSIHLHITVETERRPLSSSKRLYPSTPRKRSCRCFRLLPKPDVQSSPGSCAIPQFRRAPRRYAHVSCGHDEITHDVRLAVMEAQRGIVAGRLACSEINLHAESYSWSTPGTASLALRGFRLYGNARRLPSLSRRIPPCLRTVL